MRTDNAAAFERIPDTSADAAGSDEKAAGSQSEVLIVVNAGEESVQMTLPAETAQQYTVLADELETGEEKAALSGGVLTVPAYGVAILTP